ncbi:protein pitchfork-like [Pomacea canaliculata]|uniref:protein pitchfork-like n=1 Tax=Pomacea canaliculata TaxID=400727 RepID=UPI000D72CE71|nr:protein pitchfork-like [Pomacea canaliculata]
MEVHQQHKTGVAFLASSNRQMYPFNTPYNRFGNEMLPIRGAPNRGPGCYNNEEKTNFMYVLNNKIISSKGYTLGARTANRFTPFTKFQSPSSWEYQEDHSEPRPFTSCKKPFLAGSDRFPVNKRNIMDVIPGPGTYEHNIPRNRQVQWHQSFGSAPVLMPAISIKSTIPPNTDKLYSTKEEKKYQRKLAYLKLYYD